MEREITKNKNNEEKRTVLILAPPLPSVFAKGKQGRKVIQYRLIDNFDIHRPVDALLVYEQFKLVGTRQAHTKLLLPCIPFNQLLGAEVRSVRVTSGFDPNESGFV